MVVGSVGGMQDPWGQNQEDAEQESPPDVSILIIVIGEEINS